MNSYRKTSLGSAAHRRGLLATVVTLCTLALLAGGLRLYGAAATEPTRDEAFSWRLTQYSVGQLVLSTAQDVHPPLYYIVLKLWTVLAGDTILALRMLSALCGVGTVLVTYLATVAACGSIADGKEAQARIAGITSAGIVGLHPDHILAAQTARMYALATLLGVMVLYLLALAMREPSRARVYWPCYGFCLGVLSWTHNSGLAVAGAHMIVGCCILFRNGAASWNGVRVGRQGSGFGTSVIIALLIYIPWSGIFLSQVRSVLGGYWIPALSWSEVIGDFATWLCGFRPPNAALSVAVSVLFIAPILVTCCTRIGWILMAHAFGSWVCFLGPSVFTDSCVYQPRYLLVSQVGVAMASGLSIFLLSPRIVRAVLVWLIASFHCAGAVVMADGAVRPPMREPVRALRSMYCKGDVLVVSYREMNIVRYHQKHERLVDLAVRCIAPPVSSGEHVAHLASIDEREIIARHDRQSLQDARVWMIAVGNEVIPWTPPSRTPVFEGVFRRDRDHVVVRLYSPRDREGTKSVEERDDNES